MNDYSSGKRVMKYDPPAPPVTERPICPNCRKQLRPVFEDVKVGSFEVEANGGYGYTYMRHVDQIVKRWTGRYRRSYGYFCSNTCAGAFGQGAYKSIIERKLIRADS